MAKPELSFFPERTKQPMSSKPKKPKIDDTLDWADTEEEETEGEETWLLESESTENTHWDAPSLEEDDGLVEINSHPVLVGHRETVSLPEQEIHRLLARFATDSERSSLHGNIRQVVANHITLELGKAVIELPVFEENDTLLVAVCIQLGSLQFRGNLQVVATSGTPFLVLGRDLIAGQVIVDPSNSWIQSER